MKLTRFICFTNRLTLQNRYKVMLTLLLESSSFTKGTQVLISSIYSKYCFGIVRRSLTHVLIKHFKWNYFLCWCPCGSLVSTYYLLLLVIYLQTYCECLEWDRAIQNTLNIMSPKLAFKFQLQKKITYILCLLLSAFETVHSCIQSLKTML